MEYVPVFIYDTDRNLSVLQKTRDGIATSGDLRMLDIDSYLRNQIARNFGPKDSTAVSHGDVSLSDPVPNAQFAENQ